MELYTKSTSKSVTDVKAVRETVLQFIKQQLRKMEGGEASNLKALQLYVAASGEDRHMYEAALYTAEPSRFKDESIQKIADDYAIELPSDWIFDISFVDTLPSGAVRIEQLDAAMIVESKNSAVLKTATAYITILNGEAEKDVYMIHSTDGKINIGANKKVQDADGFFRVNHISFPSVSNHESNKFISRQHAHIEFNNESGQFWLFADEGGVPPRNKVKVRSVHDAVAVKIQSVHTGHALREGDQIMLGDSAVLEFSFSQPS